MKGITELWRGEWPRAKVALAEGARLALPGFWFGPQHGFVFLLLALSGERDEAYALLDEVKDALPSPGTVNTLGSWNLGVLVAEGVGVLGDVERARTFHPVVEQALATGTIMRQYDGGLLQRSAGVVAAAAGLRERAEEHYETALRQAEQLPHLMERPHVRHSYARFLIARGGHEDRARAGALLSEAVAGYRAIGMPRHQAMARQVLAPLT